MRNYSYVQMSIYIFPKNDMCHTTPPTKKRHGFKYFTQTNSSLVKFCFIPVKSR
jgi:hypothetical protein